MLVFGECCLPCGRPWRDSHALEVTLMPTVPPVTDIPHGFEGALPPAPALHAQAALLPHKLQKKMLFPASHSHQEPRVGPVDMLGDATALPPATRPMSLPQFSFQSHLSCTLGKPTSSPCHNPALPMGDRACTQTSLSIYTHLDF